MAPPSLPFSQIQPAFGRMEESLLLTKRMRNFSEKLAALQREYSKDLDAIVDHYTAKVESLSPEFQQTSVWQSCISVLNQTRTASAFYDQSASLIDTQVTSALTNHLQNGQKQADQIQTKVTNKLNEMADFSAALEKTRRDCQKQIDRMHRNITDCTEAKQLEVEQSRMDVPDREEQVRRAATGGGLRSMLKRKVARVQAVGAAKRSDVRKTRARVTQKLTDGEEHRRNTVMDSIMYNERVDHMNVITNNLHKEWIPKVLQEMCEAEQERVEIVRRALGAFARQFNREAQTLQYAYEAMHNTLEKVDAPSDASFFTEEPAHFLGGDEPPTYVYELSDSLEQLELFSDEFRRHEPEPTLEDVIGCNERLRRYFTEFLSSQLAVENLEFLVTVGQFEDGSSDAATTRREAIRIFRKFIDVNATARINLSADTISQVENALDSDGGVTRQTFTAAKNEVYRLLKKNLWKDFITGECYENYRREIGQIQ